MKKVWKIALLGVFSLFALYVIAVVLYNGYHPPTPNAATACQVNAAQLLSDINTERQNVGAPALVVDQTLATTSHQKYDDMVNNQYYGHNLLDGQDFSSMLRKAGVNAAVSEDLDMNAMSPAEDWATFKQSPAHYKSMTNPNYTRVGIASYCTNYVVKHVTGPDDNSSVQGQAAKEITVVQLAGPEPVQPAQPQQQSSSSTNCTTFYAGGTATTDAIARTYCN